MQFVRNFFQRLPNHRSTTTLARTRRLPARSALTFALCLSLAVAPVTATANPTGPVRSFVLACSLLLSGLASGQEPPKQNEPPAVRKAEDVAKEVEAIERSRIAEAKAKEAAKTSISEPAKGSGWDAVMKVAGKPFNQRMEVYMALGLFGIGVGLTYRALWAWSRGYVARTDRVMQLQRDFQAEEKTAYEAAKVEFVKAEQVYYEAVEREALADRNGREALEARVKAQVFGPAKDRLLKVLAERKKAEDEAAPTASVPEGPTMAEAFEALIQRYTAMREVYLKARERLLATGLEPEKLPDMPAFDKLVENLETEVRQILGIDKATTTMANAYKALADLEKETQDWLSNQTHGSRRPWMALTVPAVTAGMIIAPEYWPVYLAGGGIGWALWGANRKSRWRATLLFTMVAVGPMVGYLTHQYFAGQEAKVELADTRGAQTAVEIRWITEWATLTTRYQEYTAQSYEYGWKQLGKEIDAFKNAPSPVKPSGNPAAPNPQADTIQTVLEKIKKDMVATYGEKDAPAHMLEFYEMVALSLSLQSPKFNEQTPDQQNNIVKFLAKQMLAHPYRSIEPPGR